MRTLLLPSFLLMAFAMYGQIPCNGEFLLSGTAVQQGNCIQLTASTTAQQGCAWLNTPVDFSQPFTHNMSANFGVVDGSGADGICLIYQTGGPTICGISGGGIGAQGIANSFIVEFDTWDNGAIQSDIAPDHSAISINGDLNNQQNGPVALPNIEDGQNHTITFSWNPVGNQYTVIFDGNTIMSGSFDIISQCFGGNTLAYWGYTASTGAAFNNQSVCPILPPPITTNAGADVIVPCASAQLTLDGTGTAVGPYTYSWSSPNGGTIISGGNTLTPTVMGAGTYILTLTDPNGGCEETDEVVVNVDPLEVNINAPVFAPCAGGEVLLDGSASSSGGFITYQWSTPNGLLLSAPNQPTVLAGAPGTYTLTITYNDGQVVCTEQESVTLQPNIDIPVATATGGDITCNNPVVALNGLGPYIGPQFSYQWITSDGLIVSGAQTLTPVVSQPGLYTLTVVNTNTNCMSQVTVEVEDETDPPVAAASALGELGCNTSQVTLTGAGSDTGQQIEYSWQTNDGNIVSGANTLTPTVDAPGNYVLLVTNEETGCFSIADVTVAASAPGPAVDIIVTDTLNCAIESVTLDASGSEQSTDFIYDWTTTDGLLLSGADTLVATAGAPGTYYFSVSDTLTNCITTDSVVVIQQLSMPVADAGPDQNLDCGTTSVSLDGSGTGLPAGYVPIWSTPNGSLLSGGQTLAPTAGGPGLYVLTVLDTATQCTGTDTVLIVNDGNVPSVSIALPDTLDCATSSLDLIGNGATAGGNGFTVAWSSTDGHPITNASQLTATVTEPGTYTLEILDTLNDCSAIASVLVLQDTLRPVASIEDTDTLTCANTMLTLDGTGSSSGQGFDLQWSTSDGQILTGSETYTPVVNEPGTYVLEILNTQNQCSSTASITVAQDTTAPLVSIMSPATITCADPTVMLSAEGTSTGPNMAYNWSSTDGVILSGTQSLSPEVNASGTYTLQVANSLNGCSSTATVFVPVDTLSPIAAAGPDDTLNCYQPALQLGSSNTSAGNRFTYDWSGSSPIAGDTTTPMPLVETGGTFQLVVTDTVNGCQSSDSVTLTEDFEAPLATLAMPDTLNCVDSLVTLNGSGSSTNGNFRYEWTALNSGVMFVSDNPTAEVTAAGPYVLEVEDLDNGCTATDTAEVFQDTNLPVAAIELADTLTCARSQVTLNAALSNSNNNLSLQWSTMNGSILSGQNGLQPVVDAPGVYELVVTDLNNDCTVNASVAVAIDTLSPALSLSPTGVLNCRDTVLTLNGSTPAPAAQWTWSTSDGNLLSGADTPAPTIDQPGTYQATVLTPTNGCTNTLSRTVLQDITLPNITIAPAAVLTCTRTSVLLNGSASDQAPGWNITWQAADGSSINDTLLAEVEMPGTYTLEIQNTDNFCRNMAAISVQQDTLQPTVTLIPADTLDCGTPTIALNSNVSTTAAPAYQWTSVDGQILSGANSLNATAGTPGWYYFTATNENNGCQTIDSLLVLQDTIAPTLASLAPAPLTCTAPQSWLNAATGSNPTWTYSWTAANGGLLNSPADSNAVEVTAAGTYQVLVTNPGNACTATQSYTVTTDTLSPVVSIAQPDTLNCAVSSVPLAGNGSDSGTGFSLSWSTDDGQLSGQTDQPEATANAPGTYTLFVENLTNGCTTNESVVVPQDTLAPTAQIAAADTLNCNISSILLDATGSSTGNTFAYAWTTGTGLLLSGADGLQPEAGAAGEYTLEVTNLQNFCTTTSSVTVPIDTLSPEVSLAPPTVLNCDQNSVPLSGDVSNAGTGYDLVWNGPAGGFLSGQDGLEPVVAQPGTYSLTITNPNNGCSSAASVAVTQDITPPIADAGTDFIIPCFPELRQLDGSNSSAGPTFSYSWSSTDGAILDDNTTLNPAIDAPGTYTLLVTNTENGCTATDDVEVSQDIPEATSTTIQPLCFGDSGQISFENITGGAPPYVYSINGGDTYENTPSFQVQAPGTYTLIVQDVNGCEAVLTTSIVQPDSLVVLMAPETAEINYGESQAIQLQSNYPLGELTNITWSPNPGLDCYDCLSPIASPRLSTVYQVTATNANGCRDQASIRIIVKKDIPVYIPTAFSPNGDGNNDWFTVYAGQGTITNIRSMQIFNRWGEQVFQNQNFQPNVPAEGWDGLFRNQYLNPGVFAYVVEVEYFDGTTDLLKGDFTLAQ